MATLTADDLIDRAGALADDVLFPIAQDVDRAPRVPAGSLEAIAAAGLFGTAGPTSHGGLDVGRAAGWRIASRLGGACGATFFVWVQHHTVVRTIRSSSNGAMVDGLLRQLCSGERIAGVAFAHLRRAGPPPIRATRTDGGWLLDGFSPWTTSWGIADCFAIAGESDDGELVWAMIPGDGADGVVATPLSLPVFMSTGTVSLRFHGCFVPDEQIASIESADEWRPRDRYAAAIGNPVTHGLAQRSARLLAEMGQAETGRHDPNAAGAARRIQEECDVRAAAFDELLSQIDDSDEFVERASDHRAACIELAQRAATALLAAVGGRGMDLGHPAQRIAREADFFVIQAQTADGRAATLRSV